VSQRSLGRADSTLPEATGASQSNDEASEVLGTRVFRTSYIFTQSAPMFTVRVRKLHESFSVPGSAGDFPDHLDLIVK